MITKIVITCFIAGFTSQLSALNRVGQRQALKFTDDKIIVVNKDNANIPIKVTAIESEIEGLTIKVKEMIFEIQHTSNSIYTCTLRDQPLASIIMFNTTSCEPSS